MTFKHMAVAACASAVALASGTSAMAQQAAAPAAPAVTHGAPVPGLCVISMEGAIARSTVGKHVESRMQQIIAQVNAELTGERTGIDNEAKALEGQRATLDANTFEQRASALQVRANALQRKASLREREVQATEQEAIARVGRDMEPLIRQAYQQKACSVLLQRQAIVFGNPALDITDNVVTALNARLTTFPIERKRLDQAAAAPAAAATPAGAARPAATPARR
jgi:outer membrane protein